jgi:hypothetical protein
MSLIHWLTQTLLAVLPDRSSAPLLPKTLALDRW